VVLGGETMTLVDVKVGETVILCMAGWGSHMQLRRVSKVGKLHIQIEGEGDGSKYRKSTGYKAGRFSSSWYVIPYEESRWREYLAQKRREEIRRSLESFDWRGCDMNLAEQVYAIISPEKK
jgi:hypothetical protein